MKTGKITAKLRDAVPVCLMVDGNEVMRYKNIELPDAIKEIEMKDFHFYTPTDGRITFQIHYENGVLPATFPAPRAKMTRAEKAAAKAAREAEAEEAAAEPATEETAPATIPEAPQPMEPAAAIAPESAEDTTDEAAATEPEAAEETSPSDEGEAEATEAEAAEETTADTEEATESEDGGMEIHYNVNGPRRKELAAAVGDFIGAAPQYMRAPTYAFAVGSYTIGRDGTLTGEANSELVETLAAQGFIAA